MNKGALLSATGEVIDISSEKKAINDFLCSQTGFAYYSWVNEKDFEAISNGKHGESWRLFFLYLTELTNANNAYSAALRAAEIELLFDKLTEEDILKITDYNSDLVKAIAQNSKNREGNIIIKALVDISRQTKRNRNDNNLKKKFIYLKNIGIKDPNIEMWLAVMANDVPKLQAAINAGADVHMTSGKLLAKYAKELQNCTLN